MTSVTDPLSATGRRVAGVLLSVGALACVTGCQSAPDGGSVRDYVDAAVDLMNEGINGETTAWQTAVAQRVPDLEKMTSKEQTYGGLSALASVAGGRHSFLLSPEQAANLEAPYQDGASFPTPTVSTSNGISVVVLPSFYGQEPNAIEEYQNAGITALRAATAQTTCGWIVDLRDNSGGNTWPMMSAVAPLMSDGDVMGFRDRDNATSWVSVTNGNVDPGSDDIVAGVANFQVDQPVAILTSGNTASAAEVVVTAFAQQSRTVRVGTPTAGLTTGNVTHDLSDGAVLVLSTSWYVDRTGTRYDGPINPDLFTAPGSSKRPLDTAEEWLATTCR